MRVAPRRVVLAYQSSLLDVDQQYLLRGGEALTDASLSYCAYRNIALALVEDREVTIILVCYPLNIGAATGRE